METIKSSFVLALGCAGLVNQKTLRKMLVRCLAGFGILLFVGSIHAQSLIVAVTGAQFTTYVEAQSVQTPLGLYPPISRTTVSSSPISDEIDQTNGDPFPSTDHAIANAGVFVVSAQTGWGIANATATSQLWFSPLADQTQTIGISISCPGVNGVYTAGSIDLLDLTSNTELWNYNYNWDPSNPGIISWAFPANFPWDSGLGYQSANFNVDTDFLASDQYELTMITVSQAGDDSESAQIQLTGLDAVPEPSTTRCLAMYGALFIISRRLWAKTGFMKQ